MAGHTTIANGATGLAVRTILNTELTELFGENAKAMVSVADTTALNAIPAEYLAEGKLVYVVDSKTIFEWDGANFAEKTGPLLATSVTTTGAVEIGTTLDVTGKSTLDDLDVLGVTTASDMSNLNGGITVTPADDRQAVTLRRNSARQYSQVLEIQTEANGHLAGIDALGSFDGVDAIMSGDIAGATVTATELSKGGTGHFGGAANYSEFEADGTLKFNGDAAVWKDLITSASNLRSGGSPPTFAQFLNGVYGYRFDAGTADELHGSFELQHDYKEGTDLDFHVHWSPTTTNNGNIVWGVEYTVQNINGVFPATTTVTMTPTAAGGVANAHKLFDIATITGTGLKIGAVVVYRVFRQNGGTDTFTGNAFLHSVGIHYQCDTVGSRQELVK